MRNLLFDNVLPLTLALVFPILIVTAWFRRSTRRQRTTREWNEPLEGTASDREAAEAALQGTPLALRERLLESHRFYDRFSTMHGFTEPYMGDLTKTLNDAGISSEILFQDTMPVGVSEITNRQGFYELYIAHDDFDRARPLLKAWEQRRP